MYLFMLLVVLGLPDPIGVFANPQPVRQLAQADNKIDSPERGTQRQAFKRLILKDGSYQPISKYEINGKVVRYFSAERHEWEEVPYSLVDWSATESYARQTASERQVRATQSAEADAKERAEEDAKTPLVSPGIRLPETGGVFLLDTFNAKPELNQLQQNGADINKNTAGNILRGAINPIASAKRTIELTGLHAQVQSHVANPQIYVALESGGDPATDYTPETAKDHFRIVRCEEKKGNRVVGIVNIAVYGKVNQRATYIETKVEPVSGNWVKITPAAPLPPGEYALVEILGKQGINTFVWDFGMNASAPANANSRKAEAITTDDRHPTLQKRDKPAKP
jgi:hypothetical protein